MPLDLFRLLLDGYMGHFQLYYSLFLYLAACHIICVVLMTQTSEPRLAFGLILALWLHFHKYGIHFQLLQKNVSFAGFLESHIEWWVVFEH